VPHSQTLANASICANEKRIGFIHDFHNE